MSAFGNVIVNREINSKQKPEVIVLKPDQILAVPQIYAELDLLSISTKDLNLLQNRHFVSINQVTEMLRFIWKTGQNANIPSGMYGN